MEPETLACPLRPVRGIERRQTMTPETWYDPTRIPPLIVVLVFSTLVLLFIALSRRGQKLFIRKIAGIEAYAPTDNVAEMTARINDEGWETAFSRWLEISRLSAKDAVFIFSVGGGNEEEKVSVVIVEALKYAKKAGAKILGVVGRDGGATARAADACVIIPSVNPGTLTPHTEAFQSVIWHLIISLLYGQVGLFLRNQVCTNSSLRVMMVHVFI